MYVETLTGVLFWSSDLLGNIFALFVFHLRPSPDHYYYDASLANGGSSFIDSADSQGIVFRELCAASCLKLASTIFPTSHPQSTVGRSGLPSHRIDFLACSDSAPVLASGTLPDFPTEKLDHIPVYAVMQLSSSYFFPDPRSPPHARFTWDRFALRDRQHRVLFNDRIASTFSTFSNVPPDPERV